MNISNLNRTVLAVVVGSVLAAGSVAPAHAQDWRQRHSAQEQTASSSQESDESREARRKKEREEQADARQAREQAQAAREGEAARQREQAQQQREREFAAQREQQERIREQNRQTRERNEQAQERERGDRYEREQAQAQREQAREQREQARDQREDRRDDYAQAREDRRERQSDRQSDRQEQRAERQERQQDRQEQRDSRHADLPPPRRLENRQRDQRIVREKQQARNFQQAVQTTIAPQAKSYANTLYSQHRSHGYHYQQQYYWRLLQMLAAWNWNSYNYYNDPYFWTADDYRYYRGGSWYSVNRYGADILRQAINYGYQEGFYAGRADRMDGWRYDYRGAWVYRDANYGYRGFYVSQGEYNYYFRQGFRRGYEDGYYHRYRYGRSYNGSDVILGTVLSGILNLQAYRW